jgi:uncharacterized protein (DUF58 family)
MKTLLAILVIYCVIELLNLLTKKYAFTNLKFSRTIDRGRYFAGDEFTLTLEVVNNKLLPLPYVEFSEKIPLELDYAASGAVDNTVGYKYHKSTMMLLPYQKVKRKYRLKCSRRGRFYFNEVKVSAGDFFGFRTYSMACENPVELLVCPTLHPLQRIILNYKSPMGDISVKRWILDDPTIITGIREYTSNDPMNRIHWPSSVRSGSLMVKNFDFTSESKVMIILNIENSKPFWSNIDAGAIEKAIAIAASAAVEFLDAKIGTGICTNATLAGYDNQLGNMIKPSMQRTQITRILEFLARVDYSIMDTFEEHLQRILNSPDEGFHYAVVTPSVTGEAARLINKLGSRSGVSLITVSTENLPLIRGAAGIYVARKDGVIHEAV